MSNWNDNRALSSFWSNLLYRAPHVYDLFHALHIYDLCRVNSRYFTQVDNLHIMHVFSHLGDPVEAGAELTANNSACVGLYNLREQTTRIY